MNSLVNLFSAGFSFLFGSDDNANSQNTSDSPGRQPHNLNARRNVSAANGAFSPSYADICVARAMLKSLNLPTELVLEVLAFAEYEPVIEFSRSGRTVIATATMGSANSAQTCLRAEILSFNTVRQLSSPHVKLKIKEVDFEFTSKDQGWTSENTRGTYNTSSWLEVSIFRPSSRSPRLDQLDGLDNYHNLQAVQNYLLRRGYGQLVENRPENEGISSQGNEPTLAWYLQGNKVCERENCDYRVIWAPDHHEGNEGAGNGEGFFNVLKEGDLSLVWARAMVSKFHLVSLMRPVAQYRTHCANSS